MRNTDPVRKCALQKTLTVAMALAFVALASLLSLSFSYQQRPVQITAPPASDEEWKIVDRLIAEQKFEAAVAKVGEIRGRARKSGNQEEWTRALIKEAQLRTGLHGYETAVRFLKEQAWPVKELDRAVLNLFYARSLVTYYQAYSWEVNQRERVEAKGTVDLRAWTKDQIYQEAQKAYDEVWKGRAALGREPVARLAEYLDANTYPPGIRGTLRDAVSYLFVELLADTSLWKAEETGDLYRLDLKALIAGNPTQAKESGLADPSVHPLVKICRILDDLETWHAGNNRTEAALEARLERLRRLHNSFTDPHDRAVILADLEKRLVPVRSLPWWSMGRATQAEFVRESDEASKLVHARALAMEGWKAFPDSIGGKRCLHIAKSIEAPGYSLASMLTDGAARRSVELTHKNIPVLHFRAYPIELERRIETVKDYNLLPDFEEQKALIGRQKPVAEWSVDLPPTPDFELHRTFVTPAVTAHGCYLVVASARRDFSQTQGNQVVTSWLILSDIVMLTSREDSSRAEIRVLEGNSGRPVSGAQVALYRYDWQSHHARVEERLTDAEGTVQFFSPRDQDRYAYFLLARKGSSLALDSDQIRFSQYHETTEVRASLLYTDRSVYRPQQKVLWKAIAYGGDRREGRYRTLPSESVNVSLLDANGQVVEARTVSTNAFGTASGEFTVPAGRLLGSWRLSASPYGQTFIRVEEYKRPTFEVTLKDSESPVRLNRPATFVGEAKYYFGLPVVNGNLKWRVTMEPEYPWWWDWHGWWGAAPAQARMVAAGTCDLQADGTFKITFTPQVDERQSGGSKDVTYRYRLSADLTDEGGETRSASRSFRLGMHSIEARIDMAAGFLLEDVPGAASIARADLNGTPRAGKGSWRVVALKQPARTNLPADQPLPEPPHNPEPGRFRTPGDSLRPRWNPAYAYQSVLRSWPEGAEITKGEISHTAGGSSPVTLPKLAAGAYRILYTTIDDFGSACTASKDFIVAGKRTPLALPALLLMQDSSAAVGKTARFLAHSGIHDQTLFFEIWRAGKLSERKKLVAGSNAGLIEIPVRDEDRGGFTVRLTTLADYQLMNFEIPVFVPWDNKELKVEFSTFRDKLRPGGKETWRVHVTSPSGSDAETGAAEVLAYMYDRSLDIFAPHNPPSVLGLYPYKATAAYMKASLGQSPVTHLSDNLVSLPVYPSLKDDELKFYDGYGIGGPGMRYARFKGGVVGGVMPAAAPAMAMRQDAAVAKEVMSKSEVSQENARDEKKSAGVETEGAAEQPQLRSEFAETAFWRPHLLTGPDGSASIEFTVPDSVTSWNVWVHAVTRDLKGGANHKETRSFKDLMVRPYLPRFLREGDKAAIKVVVNNASDHQISGKVTLEILDPVTNENLAQKFGLADKEQPFTVSASGGTNVTFPVVAPVRVGTVAFKVVAVSADASDGELRPLPLLPGRVHLAQSRFVTLKNKDQRVMTFEDLMKQTDPTRVNEQLVVTLDAQLFYSVLSALPYLVNYPYECTEQTLNRFLSTGILTSLYRDYPAVARMAQEFSKRDTRLETWDAADPNRKMALEETPWLVQARGGNEPDTDLINVLDPRIAQANRESALAKLRKAQTSLGAFPWWPGGPPSPYMTLYIMYGLAKASEFGVDVPRDMVTRGWSYLAKHFREEYAGRMLKDDCCWEFLTFLNYAASCYPDPAWTGDALTREERKTILDHCFRHWKQHSPYLKGMLALTLQRMTRPKDAQLVFESVMDSSRTTRDEGTFWAPEERSWLWYNDTIESHAFALRTLTELSPRDARRDGLVQWLFLNKKLNHWKSTRATAEVIYSLVHYLKSEGALGEREDATVRIGGQTVRYVFEPDRYTGKKNQTVIAGEKIGPEQATITVEKESKGFVFASATWHFSTERLPETGQGDFFSVARKYFKREHNGREFVLRPMAEGEAIRPGDEVEVQLSIRSKHAAEYVHLKDPRAAGLEPENAVSRYKWDLGISWYEETRDSGTNFFFEWLPAGEYTFKYRLRANMAGQFRVGPATLQSMYAPEFNAYSAGTVVAIN